MSLVLADVAHRYGSGPWVLRSVDLEIGPGETVAIAGPSGSGKTTLLSIVGGLLRPMMGTVIVDGTAIDRRKPGSIAWVFQGVNLLPHRTVAANVAVGLWTTNPTIDALSDHLSGVLGAVGLEGFADAPAHTLSGGQAQRVGIARAIVGAPSYVIADEPTGQLDRSTSSAVAPLLVQARDPRTSLIVATHDTDLAAHCHRRFLLVDGRLERVA